MAQGARTVQRNDNFKCYTLFQSCTCFCQQPAPLIHLPVLLFSSLSQTSRTCPPLSKKNCLMRCWTETYKKVRYLLKCHSNTYHMLCVHMEAIERAKPDVTSLEAANRGVPLPQYKLYTTTGSLPSCGSVILLLFSFLTAQWSACLKLLCQMSTFVVYTAYVRPNQP